MNKWSQVLSLIETLIAWLGIITLAYIWLNSAACQPRPKCGCCGVEARNEHK